MAKQKVEQAESDKDRVDRLVYEAVEWGIGFADTCMSAGGHPASILNAFSKESIVTMVRNGMRVR